MTTHERKPNLLWVSFEDCSPRLGCYGDPLARTPHVDRLASQGIRFTKAFSTAPVCAPARCAIITGMYACSIGGQHMRTTQNNPDAPHFAPRYEAVPPPYVKSIPEYLRAVGYFCTNHSKTDYQFASPRTAWDQCGETAHWRNRPHRETPFFSVFNLEATHESGMWEDKGRPQTDPSAVRLPSYLPDTPKCREALARHYDHIACNDAALGLLLEQLEEDQLIENTIVFLWSDHGEGLPRSKRWPLDSGTHVPLIVSRRGDPLAGTSSERIVSTIDLGPTTLALAGVHPPLHMQGLNFLGNGAKLREFAFSTRDRYDEFYDGVRSMRDARYRYVQNFYPLQSPWQFNDYLQRHPIQKELNWQFADDCLPPGPEHRFFGSQRAPEELYDLVEDPEELNNLAENPLLAHEMNRLRSVLRQWQIEIGDLIAEPEEQMAERFWPGGQQPRTLAPKLIIVGGGHDGLQPVTGDQVEVMGPAFLHLHCGTQGASMAFRLESEDPRTVDSGNPANSNFNSSAWCLYQAPIRLMPGRWEIQAFACRIGYQDSQECSHRLSISPTPL